MAYDGLAQDADGVDFVMKTITVAGLRAILATLPDDAKLMPHPITRNLIIIPAGEEWGESHNQWIDIGGEMIDG